LLQALVRQLSLLSRSSPELRIGSDEIALDRFGSTFEWCAIPAGSRSDDFDFISGAQPPTAVDKGLDVVAEPERAAFNRGTDSASAGCGLCREI